MTITCDVPLSRNTASLDLALPRLRFILLAGDGYGVLNLDGIDCQVPCNVRVDVDRYNVYLGALTLYGARGATLYLGV